MSPSIRVLVVEDSLTVRRRLCEVLAGDPSIEVVGEAEDGKRAIEMCIDLRPDIITLDMVLPVMSGLAATEYIMAYAPTPILIVSASTNRGELFKTYEALAAGAVDVLEKPTGLERDGTWERTFLSTVKLVSKIKVITHPRARLNQRGSRLERVPPPAREWPPREIQLVAIGASTGGPRAVLELLRSLPKEFTTPTLVVIHIGAPFASAFADWLNGETGRTVSCARDGELVSQVLGRVVIAPPDTHMTVRAGRIRLTSEPPRHSCRPSVDTLFESVALEYGSASIGCLLTGMGRDGAAGMLEMRMAGAYTIAEDESTCVVYGMPREAVLLGAVAQTLPISEIGPAVARLCLNRQGGARAE